MAEPEKVFVKTKVEGATMRDPVTLQKLAPEGEWKPRDVFWIRRLRDGDVVEATPPPEPSAPKEKAKGKE